MPKYYVQCGTTQLIVQAEDAQGAALWGVHQIIDDHLDLESIDWTDPEEVENLELIRVMLSLGDAVDVSEIGFGRSEAGQFDTPSIMTEWSQLIVAVSLLQQKFSDAHISL